MNLENLRIEITIFPKLSKLTNLTKFSIYPFLFAPFSNGASFL